jgi:hypothetical protein
MRPKVVIGVLLAVALAAAGVLGLKGVRTQPPPSAQPESPARPGPNIVIESIPESSAPDAGSSRIAPATNAASADSDHAKYVRRRVYELNLLAMKSDPASRDAILAELENPDPEIRKGARDAAIQSGDRSVVPRLKEVAEKTQDPAEKAEILAAIEYINLPSLTEFLADQRAKMAAAGMTNLPRSGTNRVGRRRPPAQVQPPTQP